MQNFPESFWTAQLGNKISELGRMAIEFAQHGRYRPNEHSCVPAKISLSQKRFGEIGIGFLAKALNSVDGILVTAIPHMNGLTLFDITETGTGPGRFDTNGDKLSSVFCGFRGKGEGFLKCDTIRNDMIGWKHGHCRGMISGRNLASTKRHCRCRVAFGWLGKNILAGEIREQFTNCRFLLRVRQDQNAFAGNQSVEAHYGFFKESVFRNQAQQLLRLGPATQWPKPFATATGENQRIDRFGHCDAKISSGSTDVGPRRFPFLFPKRDVYGRRCRSQYPFLKLPNSFPLTRCSSLRG